MAVSSDDVIHRLRERAGGVSDDSFRQRLVEKAGMVPPAPTKPTKIKEIASGLNLGFLSDALGAPVDIVNTVISPLGLDTPEPAGGSKFFARLMRQAGIVLPEGVGGSTERISREVGFGVASALPVTQAARLGSVNKLQSGPIKQLVNAASQRAKAFLFGEAAAGLGSGVGAEVAREFWPDSPWAELASRITGAVTATGTIDAVAKVAGGTGRLVADATKPFRAQGKREIAGRILRESAQDPARALDNLHARPPDFEGAIFTSAQLADDPGLLALERGVIVSNSALGGRYKAVESQLNIAAHNEINKALGAAKGDPARLSAFLTDRTRRLVDMIDDRVSAATRLAKRTIDNLSPHVGKAEASKLARQEIEAAYKEARKTERSLWNTIYRDELVDTSPIAAMTRTIKDEARKADAPDNFPKFLSRLFSGTDSPKSFSEMETVDQIMGLRSRLLHEIRTEAAKDVPNRVRIRNLERVNDKILDTLSGKGGDAATAAREFSLRLNNRFTRGPIGRLRGFHAQGGAKVDEAVTLNQLFARGEQGGVNADALQAALSENPEGIGAVIDYLKESFVLATLDPGTNKINSSAAGRFIRQYDDFLKRFPALRADLVNAQRGLNRADHLIEMLPKLSKVVVSKTRAGLFLKTEDPVRVVSQVLDSGNPTLALRSLIKSARKDGSGIAMDGLRASVAEALFRKTSLRSLDATGIEMLSAANFRKVMQQYSRPLLDSGLIDASGLKRLQEVNRALNIAEKTMTSRLIKGSSDTAQNVNVLTDMVARILGSKLGTTTAKRTGGQSLLLSGAAIRKMREWLVSRPAEEIQGIIEEAIFSPDLMRSLKLIPTAKTEPIIMRHLRGALLNIQTGESEQ